MKIGIKYCGGCNSRYDRSREIQRLIQRFPQHTFVYATHGETCCDVWIIVCGCVTACASTEGLTAVQRMFTVFTPRQLTAVAEYLEQYTAEPSLPRPIWPQPGDTVVYRQMITPQMLAEFDKLTQLPVNSNRGSSTGTALLQAVPAPFLQALLISAMTAHCSRSAQLQQEQFTMTAPAHAGEQLLFKITLKGWIDGETHDTAIYEGNCSLEQGPTLCTGTYTFYIGKDN
jgi:hypothetical protein